MGTSRSGRTAQGGSNLNASGRPIHTEQPSRVWALSAFEEHRFYGRRKGRKLSRRQSYLLSEKLPGFHLDPALVLESAEAVNCLFRPAATDTWLEIGFGAGEHLIWQVENNPGVGLIGAEPFINGVAAAASRIQEKGLESRVRLHADDVTPLLSRLPEASIGKVFMLFPDPWPKKRHRQRRLLSRSLLDRLSILLKDDAEFRFASDIADYAEAALHLAQAHPNFEVAQSFTSANRNSVPDWPATRYETKAAREGRASAFLIVRRKWRR